MKRSSESAFNTLEDVFAAWESGEIPRYRFNSLIVQVVTENNIDTLISEMPRRAKIFFCRTLIDWRDAGSCGEDGVVGGCSILLEWARLNADQLQALAFPEYDAPDTVTELLKLERLGLVGHVEFQGFLTELIRDGGLDAHLPHFPTPARGKLRRWLRRVLRYDEGAQFGLSHSDVEKLRRWHANSTGPDQDEVTLPQEHE